MYAIAEIAGRQFQCEEGVRLRVPLLKAEAGEKITVDRVLAVVDGDVSRFGDPLIEGAAVETTVIQHGRAPKVICFKMKRRKGYRRKLGHRQSYTLISVDKITS